MDDQTRDTVIRLQEKVAQLEGQVKVLVTQAEFGPVRAIAYGLAATILSSVLGAVLAKVLIK